MKNDIRGAAGLFLWAFWLGGLWIMALLIAPALFKWLPKPEAGLVAGRLFMVFGLMSVVVPGLLWLISRCNQKSATRSSWLALLWIAVLAMLGLFVIQPHIRHLREVMANVSGDELAALRMQFGCWHGVSSVMFALQMLTGLWWGWQHFVWTDHLES